MDGLLCCLPYNCNLYRLELYLLLHGCKILAANIMATRHGWQPFYKCIPVVAAHLQEESGLCSLVTACACLHMPSCHRHSCLPAFCYYACFCLLQRTEKQKQEKLGQDLDFCASAHGHALCAPLLLSLLPCYSAFLPTDCAFCLLLSMPPYFPSFLHYITLPYSFSCLPSPFYYWAGPHAAALIPPHACALLPLSPTPPSRLPPPLLHAACLLHYLHAPLLHLVYHLPPCTYTPTLPYFVLFAQDKIFGTLVLDMPGQTDRGVACFGVFAFWCVDGTW